MKIGYFVFLSALFPVVFSVVACKRERGILLPIHYSGSYSRDFNDLNEQHLEAAQHWGIEPVASREEAERMTRKLEEIEANDYYVVNDLTHSIPFLVPKAEKLLKMIGHDFRDSLESHHAPLYKLKITSITRTREDVEKLRKRNVNSSENSAHLYGTTFDISWAKYVKCDQDDSTTLDDGKLKMLLASVLRNLQQQEKCYVKHERKQGCFHITVR